MTRRMPDILAFLIATLLPAAAFYPGLMNADSLTIYAGAVIPAPPTDWHSAFLAYAWRGMIRLGLPLAAFTVLQTAVFLAALLVLARRAGLGTCARLLLLAAVLLVPPAMTWLATLEKTTFLGVMLAASFAVASRIRPGLLPLHAAFALAGIWSRPNGLIVFAPLVAWTCWQALRPRAAVLAAAAIIALGVLVPLGGIRAGLVVPSYPQQATMDLDLLNLSFRTGQDLLPGNLLLIPFAQAQALMAADPTDYNPLQLVLRRMTSWPELAGLQSAWLHAIAAHPGEYLAWRLQLFLRYECFDPDRICLGSWHWYTGGIDANVFGLTAQPWPPAFAFYRALAGTPFYRPGFWSLVTLALLAAAVLRRRRTTAAYAAVLLLCEAANFFFLPGPSARLAVPLGLMAPLLALALRAEAVSPPRAPPRDR